VQGLALIHKERLYDRALDDSGWVGVVHVRDSTAECWDGEAGRREDSKMVK
jgi:hypothetical protein